MEWLTDPQMWVAFLTLTVLELVLGIDNVVFISILAGKLPHEQQQRARTLGLSLAMLMRIALLFALSWIIRLTAPLFTVLGQEIRAVTSSSSSVGCFCLARAPMRSTRNLRARRGTPRPVSNHHSRASLSRFSCSTWCSRWTR